MGARVSSISSGVDGLDTILRGGLVTGRLYLIQGQPGTGKTLLGMHFLEKGLENDETVLFIHGEEPHEEILANGEALDIDIADAEFLDLGPVPFSASGFRVVRETSGLSSSRDDRAVSNDFARNRSRKNLR